MGGKQHRFFLLGFFNLEPAVLLGMYLLSANFVVSLTRQGLRRSNNDREAAKGRLGSVGTRIQGDV